MNGTVMRLLSFYMDNESTMKKVDENLEKEYKELWDEMNAMDEKIVNILMTKGLSKEDARHIVEEYDAPMHGINFINQKYMFEFAFMMGLKLGQDLNKINELFKENIEFV